MATEKEAASASRKTLLLGVLVVFIVIGGGFVLWSWLLAPPPAQSNVSITRVTAASNQEATESQEYRNLLREANQQGARQARARDESFIASIPMGEDVPVAPPAAEPPPEPAPPPVVTRSARRQAAQQESQETALNDNQKAALQQLIGQIRNRHPGGGMVRAVALSTQTDSGVIPASLQAGPAAAPAAAMPVTEIVPPYTRIAGVVATAVDSDITDAPVLIHIPAGRYAGAVLHADRAPLAGDGVDITLTRMAWKGVTYQVSARALQDDTLLPSVASHVNNRYFSRIILPGIAGMATEVGSLYASSGTQILSTGTSTLEGRTGTPDTAAVLGVMAGGMGKEAGNVIRQDAGRLPVRQATVTPGEVVAVQFLGGVYSSDDIRRGNTPAETPTPQRPGDTLRLRQQAQERVDRRLRQEDL